MKLSAMKLSALKQSFVINQVMPITMSSIKSKAMCAKNAAVVTLAMVCSGLAGALLAPLAQAADSSDISLGSAQSTPAQWLGRMNSAFAELDYDGVFSFWSSGNMATLRVVHMSKDNIEHERLVHLNGAPREIIREGDEVLCILQPGDRLVAMGGSIPAGPFAKAFLRDFASVASNYDMAMKGEGRIASRPAVRIAVMPRDVHRYGFRLWLDKETGLLLKSELLDEAQDSALEVFQFSQLVMGDEVSEEALKSDQPSGSVIDHLRVADESVAKTKAPVKWSAGWLPEGFEMAASDLRHAPATKQDVSTLMYSDGLAAVSVFIENLPNEAATNMLTRKGATVSVTQLVHGPDKARHLVTVIGEVPPKTAAQIASNVSYTK